MALDHAVDLASTFEGLGMSAELCETVKALGYKRPTKIQSESIPAALEGKDIIGVAQTGSGKTAAFAIPIIEDLIKDPSRKMLACILAPTRELATQIAEQFEALGECIKLKCTVVVGGINPLDQAISVAKKPHVIIGTPGRMVQLLEETKGFSLHTIKYLVMDEADRLLEMAFEDAINKLLAVLPKERRTYLYSATMTQKVSKLQRASLVDPVKVEVSENYSTVDTLVQQYLFVPQKYKDCYLAYVLNSFAGAGTMIFVGTCVASQRITLMLRTLGFKAIPLNGDMDQKHRFLALEKYKGGSRNILVATDVASRGIDIPSVDLVVNYDLPVKSEDYVHRVGRTARAGKGGRAITIVTQYDVEVYQRIETLIKKKLDAYPSSEADALTLLDRVTEAQRTAAAKIRDEGREGIETEEGVEHDDIAASAVITKRKHAGGYGANKKRKVAHSKEKKQREQSGGGKRGGHGGGKRGGKRGK